MKVKEQAVAKALNKVYPNIGELTPTEQHCRYDFECKHYIIEVKCRLKRYDPWIIEKAKVDWNIDIAEKLGKDFLYLTEIKKDAYIWNISKMLQDEYDFQWTTKNLPQNTEFSNRRWTKKHIGYLYEKDATFVQL